MTISCKRVKKTRLFRLRGWWMKIYYTQLQMDWYILQYCTGRIVFTDWILLKKGITDNERNSCCSLCRLSLSSISVIQDQELLSMRRIRGTGGQVMSVRNIISRALLLSSIASLVFYWLIALHRAISSYVCHSLALSPSLHSTREISRWDCNWIPNIWSGEKRPRIEIAMHSQS